MLRVVVWFKPEPTQETADWIHTSQIWYKVRHHRRWNWRCSSIFRCIEWWGVAHGRTSRLHFVLSNEERSSMSPVSLSFSNRKITLVRLSFIATSLVILIKTCGSRWCSFQSRRFEWGHLQSLYCRGVPKLPVDPLDGETTSVCTHLSIPLGEPDHRFLSSVWHLWPHDYSVD